MPQTPELWMEMEIDGDMSKDEMLERRIRNVDTLKQAYSVPQPKGKGILLKRLARKLIFWYLNPFGAAQNEFNAAAAEAVAFLGQSMEQLSERVSRQLADADTQTERRISAFTQEQRQTLARAQTAAQESVQALSQEMNESLCAAAPECRAEVGLSPLTALPAVGTQALYQEIRAVQNAQNPEQSNAALGELETKYTELLRESIRTKRAEPSGRVIALVCRKFSDGNGMEAVKNELWDLYRLLKTASRYQICILSVEPDGTARSRQGDVHYVAESELSGWLTEIDPILLVFCESTLEVLGLGKQCMLVRNSVVRLSAQNPRQALGNLQLAELLHLSDFGVHRYCTASEYAANRMEGFGFRKPAVIYPYIDTEKPLFCRRPRSFSPESFTVGFATSPVSPEQSNSRGIPALCEAVERCPEIRFLVLWRDADAVAVPEALQRAENCEIRIGKYEMAEFYSSIDCVLIPYADENYNHACSLSALEGMLMGIPAAATPQSGVSELISATGLGEVSADVSGTAIADTLRTIRGNYSAYRSTWRIDRLRKMLSGKDFVRFVEYSAEHAAPYGVITIYEWDRQLGLENKHLVKGHAALKSYYQRQDIAEDYTADRFVTYPQNCFDLMERQSVRVLLEESFRGQTCPKLLDLACGDGRILRTLLELGACTAGDASDAMLSQVSQRFADADLKLQKIDLLTDTPDASYDVITIFRFIRHYEYATRRMLWKKLRDALTDRGILLFDVPNLNFEIPNRRRTGWGKYNIYDVFWTKESIRKELADNGLELVALVPIGQGLYPLPAEYRKEPMTWTAAVRKVQDMP